MVVDAHPVEGDFAGIGRIKPGEHPQERRFARTVAAGNEDELAGSQSEVDRPDREGLLGKSVNITEYNVAHFDLIETLYYPGFVGLPRRDRRMQIGIQLLQTVRRGIGVRKDRY